MFHQVAHDQQLLRVHGGAVAAQEGYEATHVRSQITTT